MMKLAATEGGTVNKYKTDPKPETEPTPAPVPVPPAEASRPRYRIPATLTGKRYVADLCDPFGGGYVDWPEGDL
jgi:hypothetical protein